MRHIGGRATHVKTDDIGNARLRRRFGHADNTTRGTRQDGIFAAEAVAARQAAIRLHEQCGYVATSISLQLLNILPQHGRQIGIDQRRIAAPDQLDQGRNDMTDRNLGKADFGRDLCQSLFMPSIKIAMHQDDSERAISRIISRLQAHSRSIVVQRRQHVTFGIDPLVNLNDLAMQRFGQFNMPHE